MAQNSMGTEPFTDWIGRTESVRDVVTATRVAAFSATLDLDRSLPRAGDPLPPLWHWLFCFPIHRQSELGADGHAKLGNFLPPIPLSRRMWAGSRLEFRAPLRVGDSITRNSRIGSVTFKKGRTGPLYFVTVSHEISNETGVAIVEEHDIVYRDRPKANQPPSQSPAAPSSPSWRRIMRANDVLLFRYSALTFNAYRIHYDRRYCTEMESYPGLVVHGPLIATLLLDLLHRNLPGAGVKKFSFRAVSPIFDNAPFRLCGQPEKDGKAVHLWAQNDAGGLAMDATAALA